MVAEPSASSFVYVETGSYMGLSSHIVTASVLELGLRVLAYAHDQFDSSTTEIWQTTMMQEKSNLQIFYDNVRRNHFESNIIPIIGRCSK